MVDSPRVAAVQKARQPRQNIRPARQTKDGQDQDLQDRRGQQVLPELALLVPELDLEDPDLENLEPAVELEGQEQAVLEALE